MKLDILAMGAHPDDVELSCGGTLIRARKKGASVGIVTLTRAEMGTRGTPELRAQEFARAAEIIGAKVHKSLTLPDGRLELNWEAKLAVIQEIRHYQPTLVFLPYWEDRHPDHATASRIIEEAAFLAGLRKLETGQEPHRPAKLIYYMCSWEFQPDFVVDISDVIEEKKRAIQAYGSQVHNKAYHSNEEETFISSVQFWDFLMARAAYYGHRIGKQFAEPFKIKGLVEIKDVLEAFGDHVY
ncbi:MAG TPA: bacillithiol biosynthesis deacetylase BshB1 [Bacteroidetes bacterium]|nr:bacillithiol biosynthesis deacetylase BshB1 [Bacteroidota bacterium]